MNERTNNALIENFGVNDFHHVRRLRTTNWAGRVDVFRDEPETNLALLPHWGNEPLTTHPRALDVLAAPEQSGGGSGTLDGLPRERSLTAFSRVARFGSVGTISATSRQPLSRGEGGIGGLLARSDRQQSVPAILTPTTPNPYGVVTSFYNSDANGNVTALFAPSGMILAQYEYDPFGNLIAKSGLMADVNKYRFSSKEWDSQSGLYYYGYRFYDPNLQRWPNRDPLGDPVGTLNLVTAIMPDIDSPTLFDRSIDFKMENDSLNDTASLNDWSEVNANLFAGIANDPINQADPFGLDANSYAGCIEHYRNPITEQLPNAIAEAIDKHFGSGNGSGNGPHVPGWVPPVAYGANALGNLAVGKVPAALGRAAHPTTWEHVLGSKFGTVGSRIGKFAGHAAIVLTVAEGFWDLGLLGGCGIAQAIGD